MSERITVSLDPNIAQELRTLARREKVSISRLVSQAVKEYVVEKKRKEAGKKLLKIRIDKNKLDQAERELSRMREEEWR